VQAFLWFAPAREDYVPGFDTFPDNDYEVVGKWRITKVHFGHECTVTVEELKTRIAVEIPRNVFKTGELDADTFTYPNIDPDRVGEIVPVAFGISYGVPTTLIDNTTGLYKITGHALDAITRVYDGNGVTVNVITDLANGEFTYSAMGTLYADIDAGNENPADCIEKLITDEDRGAGESTSEILQPGSGDPDEGQGFGTYGSRTKWIVGYTKEGQEVHRPAISLFLDSAEELLDTIEHVSAFANALVYIDRQGRYTCRYWEPKVGQGVFNLDASDILDVTQVGDWKDPITKVIAKYRERRDNSTFQVVEVESDEHEYRLGLTTESVLEEELPMTLKVDATQWAGRTLAMRARPIRTLDVECSQRAMLLQPGDAVSIDYPRRGIDGKFEVIETSIHPGSHEVSLTVSDWRGFGNRPGFWVIDSPVFPATLGGGAASPWDNTWTDAQKAWAKQNVGYWMDDDEFMDSNDLGSYKASVWV
jgi:hypothetical protein